MSEYRRLRAGELQEECERRGIDPSGLNKRGMINALRDNDELNNDVEDVRASGGNGPPNGGKVDGDNGDEEVQFRAPTHAAMGMLLLVLGGGNLDEESDGGSDSAVAVMQLKLQLAREERETERKRYERMEREWEIEKERAELGLEAAGQTGMREKGRPSTKGDLCHLLPKMSDNDPLVFFSAFDRSLALNGVNRNEWSRYLASCLTNKVNRVLAGLTLAENQDFDCRCRGIR